MTALQTALLLGHNSNGISSFHKYYCTTHFTSNLTPLLKSPLACTKKNIMKTTKNTTTTTTTTAVSAYKDYRLHEGGSRATTISAPPAPSDHLETLHGAEEGLGVLDFLRGKNYFVTGATGFLAKVLIEKLLRTMPDVGKIYVLIRAKDKQDAEERLKNEIIDSELFKSLESSHGKSYKTFMMDKLIPVAGDVCKSEIAIESNLAAEIAQVVDVIVNSSANTTFDERYDVAINTNTRGPCRLLGFAKKCKNLCLFLHVSTAYINGESGIIPEAPLQMAQRMSSHIYTNQVDLEAELKIALQSKEASQVKTTPLMKDLGMQRAKQHGWENTYTFTKAMGEMLITNERENIPVVIIRPSVIESAYREPFPGWIEGNRMMDPVMMFYGKGQLPGFLANPKAVIDIVPVDMVVNTILVAMAKHGREAKPELNVYHASSSVSNPILLYDFFKYSCEHFNSSPLIDRDGKKIRITDMKFLSSLSDFSSYISSEIIERNGLMDHEAMQDKKHFEKIKTKCEKLETLLLHVAQLYEPYMFLTSWFDNVKVKALIEMMSAEEKKMFECDVGIIDWKQYVCNIHIPGFRTYVLKGK